MEPVIYNWDEMGGLSDWWEAATSKVSSWFDSGVATASEAYNATTDLVSTQVDETMQTLNDFRNKMNELYTKQIQVDQALEKMEPGPDLDRLKAKRDASRGTFEDYILPAWNQIAQLMGWDTDPTSMSGYASTQMGIVPVVAYAGAAAAVAIATSILVYVVQQIRIQNEILDDPALKQTFLKTQASSAGVFDSVANIFSSSKTIILVGAAAAGIGYLLLKRK